MHVETNIGGNKIPMALITSLVVRVAVSLIAAPFPTEVIVASVNPHCQTRER